MNSSVWDDLKAHLEAEKRAVTNEIRNYPQPIAGCDAQIPAFWERRDALVADISRLADPADIDTPDALVEFIKTRVTLSDDDKRKFLEGLRTSEFHAAAE